MFFTGPVKLAIVGKKYWKILDHQCPDGFGTRDCQSEIPGTTRDSVDVPFDVETDGVANRKCSLIPRASESRGAWMIRSSFSASSGRGSDWAMRYCGARAGCGIRNIEQDKKIADKIVEERKACIVVVNKWDLVEESVRKAREEE